MSTDEEYEYWLGAMRYAQYSLYDVPEPLKDFRMCLAAVQKNGYALEYVPRDLRYDYEICMAALQQEGRALYLVPQERYA